MEEHKEQYKKSIRFFNDREVRAVWDDTHNKWWFSVLDIIAAINEQDDYQKTRNYWKYLKTKLRKENSQLVSVTNQLKIKASDGKSYKTDTFDAEGVTLLAKHINNTKATSFLDWFLYSDNTIMWLKRSFLISLSMRAPIICPHEVIKYWVKYLII